VRRCFNEAVKRAATLVVLAAVLSGCGSGGSGEITIGAARTFDLTGFAPATFTAGKAEPMSFTIKQPSGAPLTDFRRGSGPHTGVHVIFVRSDLGALVHVHPPIGRDGRVHEDIKLPTAGRYRVVVDAYPNLPGALRNFQLFKWVKATGKPASPPPSTKRRAATVDGYRFVLKQPPALRAIKPAFLTVDVTRPDGSPARFTPYFGALAHAIFFRSGSLDYFHTHVCAPGMAGCTSVLGNTRVSGTSTKPGQLRVGVLLPTQGTWRLFLQTKVGGRVLTVPYTLEVK
jgi:hypothetical protein